MQLTFHAGASEQITRNVISASPGLSTVPSTWWEVEKCLQMNGWMDGRDRRMDGWMGGWKGAHYLHLGRQRHGLWEE